MSDERDLLREDGFDAELEALIGPPPDAVVKEVTPWRRAMNRVLAGVALTSFTLNFWMLNYILPLAGAILLLLGFRSLREENRWFRAGWIAAMLRTLWVMFTLALNAYPMQEELRRLTLVTVLGWGAILLEFLILLFLWNGMRAVQDKAGIPGGAGAALRLVFWYVVLFLLALVNYTGWLGVILLIVAFVRVLSSIYRLSRLPEEAGYAVRAAPVRLGDGALAAALCAVLAAAIACGYLFFQSYPMDWREFRPSEGSAVEEVRQRLLELGFPAEALDDLTEEDILACRGALRVAVKVEDYPMNEGRQVEWVETRFDGSTVHHYSTVYDTKELRMTIIAVELPEKPERWKLFHHFLWTVNPGFAGTESIQLDHAYYSHAGWNMESEFSGQVLYDKDGQTWSAPFWSLETTEYASNGILWGDQPRRSTFAAFSLPTEGERKRAYLSYCVYQVSAGWIINAMADYTHQTSRLQYPACTAVQYQMQDRLWDTRPFRTQTGQLLFHTEDAEEAAPTQEQDPRRISKPPKPHKKGSGGLFYASDPAINGAA